MCRSTLPIAIAIAFIPHCDPARTNNLPPSALNAQREPNPLGRCKRSFTARWATELSCSRFFQKAVVL